MFAKLFETERGQILVKLDVDTDDDDAPEIRFYAQPPGMGVCSVALGFKGVDFDKVEQVFRAITIDGARKAVDDLYGYGRILVPADGPGGKDEQ